MKKINLISLMFALLLLAVSAAAETVGDIEVEGTLDARGPVIGQGIFNAVTDIVDDHGAIHLEDFDHSILHSNHTYLSAVSGINTGDQDLTTMLTDIAFLDEAYVDRDCSGVISGGTLTAGSGITVNVAAGSGYITSHDGTIKTKVVWDNLSVAASNPGSSYIAIDQYGAVHAFSAKPDMQHYIYLGHVYTDLTNSQIIEVFSVPEYAGHFTGRVQDFVSQSIGALVISGNAVSEQATPNELMLSINSGSIAARLGTYTTDTATTFNKIYNTMDNGWVVDSASLNMVNVSQWNNTSQNQAGALTTMTAGYWKKDLVLRLTNGHVYYVFGQAEYATEQAAKDAAIPTIPNEITEDVIFCALIVAQKNDSTIAARIHDVRPMLDRVFGYGTAGASGSVVAHDTLTKLGLAESGHTGIEPTLNKGNVTAGSDKVTIGGTPTNAVIGAGLTIDVNPANFGLDIIKTVAGDSGSAVASGQISTINIVGGAGVVTSVSGTTLTISVGAYDSGGVARLGHAGGQDVYGGTAASENLVLGSTINATKGSVIVGTELNPIVEVDETTGEAVITGALIIQ